MRMNEKLLSLCLVLSFLMPVKSLNASDNERTFLGDILPLVPCCIPVACAAGIIYGTVQTGCCIIQKTPGCITATSQNCIKCSTKCYEKRCVSKNSQPVNKIIVPNLVPSTEVMVRDEVSKVISEAERI